MKSRVSRAALLALALGCSEEAGDKVTMEPRGSAAASRPAPARTPAPTVSARPSPDDRTRINPRLMRRFQPLDAAAAEDDPVLRARVDLGRSLFYETKLSKQGDLSCNSCHDLASYGVDHRRTSIGHALQEGRRNAPTVYNAAGSFAQFWDGRAPTVEAQAKAPITNPIEMAMASPVQVVATLKADPTYAAAFRAAFPGKADAISFDNVGTAIGAFERGLLTPGRWDDYLRGNESALTDLEKGGLKLFLDSGCMVCHTGRFLGGSMFERVGVVEPWPDQADRGRSEVTSSAADEMMFKVPTLRNVGKTAPYFHDGSAETLETAVKMMGKHQLGIEFADDEVSAISAWLRALTGPLPTAYIARRPLVAR
jgi:cytochrome c peroxidase